MNQEKLVELIKKYPRLQNSSNWQTVEPSKIEGYKAAEKIKVISPAGPFRRITVSQKLLHDVATNPSTFFTLKKFFEDQDRTEYVYCYEDKNYLVTFPVTRYELLKGLETLSKQEDNPDREKFQSAFESFKEISPVENLTKMYEGKYFLQKVDGKQVKLPYQELLSLVTMPVSKYKDFIQNYDESKYGITLEEYLYTFSRFSAHEDYFSKAYFDDKQIIRFENIYSYNTVDFQTVNEIVEDNNPLLSQTVVNPELQEAILGKMPEGYDDLQKAQYIYLKMCQLLTYDTEFYAVHQKGPKVQKHRNINYVQTITPENNQAVCFEFSVIYGKLLSQVTENLTQDLIFQNAYFGRGAYGSDHTSLSFRTGKYLVNADSVKGILCSDLTQIKSGRDTTGLVCKNVNMETKEDFFASLDGVRADIQQQLIDETKGNLPTTFKETQRLYEEQIENKPEIDLKEKLNFIMGQIADTQLEGLDAFSYLLQLRKTVFSRPEQMENLFINLVREDPKDHSQPVQTTAIITISDNYREEKSDFNYLIYRPKEGLSEISKEDLCEAFSDATFSYISIADEEVPGINAPVCREFMVNTPEYN